MFALILSLFIVSLVCFVMSIPIAMISEWVAWALVTATGWACVILAWILLVVVW